MPLHVEQVVDDVLSHLRTNYATELATVTSETGPVPRVSTPRPQDYYIGEPSRFQSYRAPSLFLITNRSGRPGEGQGREWNSVRYQEHSFLIDIVVEDTDEQRLTRMCWRHAQAVDSVLHDQEVTPKTVSDRTVKVFVVGIDYGVMFTRQATNQRVFRKDIIVELLIKHWDLMTPMGGS
jgi:hypothetical protein